MLTAARTANPIHIVLAHGDPDLGQVMDLMRAFDTPLHRLAQIRPAHAVAVRAVRHALIGVSHPRQRAARRAVLLAPLASRALRPPRRWLLPPGKIISRRRHRGVPAVAAHDPFQRRVPLDQPRVRRRQLLDHHIPSCARPAPGRRRRLDHRAMITQSAPRSTRHADQRPPPTYRAALTHPTARAHRQADDVTT